MHSRTSWRKSAAKKMVAGGPSEYCSVIRTAICARKKASSCFDVNDDGGILTTEIGRLASSKVHQKCPQNRPPQLPFAEYNVSPPPTERHHERWGLRRVVGFGSLLSRNSALFTAPNLRDFRVVSVQGYRRVFLTHFADILRTEHSERRDERNRVAQRGRSERALVHRMPIRNSSGRISSLSRERSGV